jgi:hypothetical protein
MSVASSDTPVIANAAVAGKPAVAMHLSGQLVAPTGGGMAARNVIVAVYGKPAKLPSVSTSVLAAHDTVLDWIGLLKKLENFRTLKKGWDGYNAAPPDAKPLGFASDFLDVLRRNRYVPSRLAPSVVGGVGMTFRKQSRKVYVEFSNKGTVHALFSDGVTDPVVQKVAPDLPGYRALFAKTRAYLDE